MDLINIIRTRRTIGKVTSQMPEKDKIEQILDAGTWAPSHHRTEPWKFFVLTGEGRKKLGKAYADIALENKVVNENEKEEIITKEYRKAERAPVVIVITMEPCKKEYVEWIEEVEACACAAQNMLLAAHSLGLSAIWRTGKPTYNKKMKDAFNVSEEGMVIGFIYIGYADREAPKGRRTPWQEKTEWIEDY